MKAWILLSVMALCSGALIPAQAATNATSSKPIDSVVYSAVLLFLVGFIFIDSYELVDRAPLPSLTNFMSAPTYSYVGGIILAA